MKLPPGTARLGAAFLLGVACALWLLPVLAGPAIQRLRLERDRAVVRAEELESDVRRLKDALQGHRTGAVVKQVRVEVEGQDHRVVLEAERRLQKQLSDLYAGRPVDDISPIALVRRVQGQILTIDGVRYQVDIDLVTVGPELTLLGVLKPPGGSS